MKKMFFFTFVLVMLFVLSACGKGNDQAANDTNKNEGAVTQETDTTTMEERADEIGGEKASTTDSLTIDLNNSDGKKIGTAKLEQADTGVLIKVEASDLPPGAHGFHIHETGKCDGPAFESAGGHFNPTGASHGMDHEKGSHAGDLPNLEVGEDGTVKTEVTAEHVTLVSGEENSLLDEDGSALVIHAKPDDGKSQPAGDAGDRIACGVIAR
ncbi:superoxide dismutase family protein [Bacillus sp. B190/17]|uniref:Superoxide dismutase [Cu-Zn] n=1 Tax=Bacillus lumedeiriae TaxID=3058829 RepID=A0ABW8I7X6_9BACI